MEAFSVDLVRVFVASAAGLPPESRVHLFNEAQRALRVLVEDVAPDPAACPQIVAADRVAANDYNPNKVAPTELDLLERSIAEDGFTQPVVVCEGATPDSRVVVDGFHRWTVLTTRLRRAWITTALISRSLAERMAATVRHNRARGKHQVDLMAELVRGLIDEGLDNDAIAERLGMSVEELLRLMQMTGAARLLAAEQYSREWGTIDDAAGDSSDA